MAATHKFIEPLAKFLGTWRGEGIGFYPTIKVFHYGEEATFSTWGKPVMGYTHKTWNLANSNPMHHESGYFRVQESSKVEFVNAQPTVATWLFESVTEVDEGSFNPKTNTIEVISKTITRAPTAKEPHVTQLKRTFQLKEGDEDTLLVYFDMATTNQPLQRHLEAELKRVK